MFFFRGSAQEVSGQCMGFNADKAKRKSVFLGERIFRFASTDFPSAGGFGEECGRDFVFGIFRRRACA